MLAIVIKRVEFVNAHVLKTEKKTFLQTRLSLVTEAIWDIREKKYSSPQNYNML